MLADLSLVWITTRAAGVVALVASTGGVALGLALAGRVGSKRSHSRCTWSPCSSIRG